MTDVKMNMNERMAKGIADALTKNKNLTNVEYLKVKFALENLIINIPKIIIIYGMAIFLNILVELLWFHLGYMLIRSKGYGAHAKNSSICIISSMVIFIATPYLITTQSDISHLVYIILAVIDIFIVLKYAPSFTKKSRRIDKDLINRLKIQCLFIASVELLLVIMIDNEVSRLIIGGSFIGSLMLLPVAHRLFMGEYNN